jgi:signal transduction histidine kinase
MINLLANAVKYSPEGGNITVRVARQATNAILEVVDEGIGIPEEARAQIFDTFFRAGNVSPRSSGFGIGLYIVKKIVEGHEGRIEVESAEGEGSTFRVVLPLLQEAE